MILGGLWRPLAAAWPVRGQDGTLPRRAMASPAPPSPSVKKSESMPPQTLRFGPLGSFGQTQPTGTSGKGPSHKIGYASLLPWLMKLTRAWLGAAKATFHRRFSLSHASVRRASSAAGGSAPICRPRHVNRATRGSAFAVGEFSPKLGTLDAQASKSKVSPSGPHGRLAAFCGLPARP